MFSKTLVHAQMDKFLQKKISKPQLLANFRLDFLFMGSAQFFSLFLCQL